MNKLLMAFSILGAGAIGLFPIYRATEEARESLRTQQVQWHASTSHLHELNDSLVLLQSEVAEKKNQLRRVDHQKVRLELLKLMQANPPDHGPTTRAELREKLGIRWDSSPNYVLVSKGVLKKIGLKSLEFDGDVTDQAAAVLAISPDERSQIDAIAEQVRADTANRIMGRTQRIEPAGDTIAHYSITPDPELENAISNLFTARITGVLGTERGGVFLDAGWRELRASFPVTDKQVESVTIRRTIVNGEPALEWHAIQGTSHRSGPIRYGHYPTRWFLKLFPGGWVDLAEREGFELPKDWKPQ